MSANSLIKLGDKRGPIPPERRSKRLWLSKTSKCLSGRDLYCFHNLSSDAHFFHDTPRHSACHLPLARCPRTRELGFAASNRRAAAVGEKAPEIDRRTPPIADRAVPHLARLALGAGHCQAGNPRSLASCRLSPVLDLEGAPRATRTAAHFVRGPRPDPQDVPGEFWLGCTPNPR